VSGPSLWLSWPSPDLDAYEAGLTSRTSFRRAAGVLGSERARRRGGVALQGRSEFGRAKGGHPIEMTEWVSHAAAAELVGCSTSTIEQHLDEIAHRPRRGGRPSLDRESVEVFAARWRKGLAEKEVRGRSRAEATPRNQPPTDGDVWLDATTAALVIGCTVQWVTRLALAERLPATRGG
jgi:hypothetical protein